MAVDFGIPTNPVIPDPLPKNADAVQNPTLAFIVPLIDCPAGSSIPLENSVGPSPAKLVIEFTFRFDMFFKQ